VDRGECLRCCVAGQFMRDSWLGMLATIGVWGLTAQCFVSLMLCHAWFVCASLVMLLYSWVLVMPFVQWTWLCLFTQPSAVMWLVMVSGYDASAPPLELHAGVPVFNTT